MKKLRKHIAAAACFAFILALSVSAFAACGGKEKETPQNTVTLALSANSLTLDLYETGSIEATKTGTEEAVKFTLSKEGVVEMTAVGDTVTLVPLAEGEATVTATLGTEVKTATVTVADSGERPAIVLADKPTTIASGATYSLGASVRYKGAAIDGAALTYSSSAEAVASVDEEGNLTAGNFVKDANTATITVGGSYRGYTLLAETFTVTVVEDITLRTASGKLELYTADPLEEGLATQETIGVTVYNRGGEVDDPRLTFESGNPNVATVDENGKVTAVGEGETAVTIGYVSPTSGELYTVNVSVQVTRPVVDITLASAPDFDKSLETQSVDLTSGNIPADITGATVKIGGVQVEVEIDGKTVTFDALTQVAVGENVDVTVELSAFAYRFKANVATRIISTYDEFVQIRADYWESRNDDNDEKYRDGYYIVDADIDLSATATLQAVGRNDTLTFADGQYGFNLTGLDKASVKNNWHGVFDGRGHMLYNLSVNDRGIFGVIDKQSVVKNVGFEIKRTKNDWWGGLATTIQGTVDNVYLEVDSLTNTNGNGTFARLLEGGTITNSVSVLKTKDDTVPANRHGVLVGEATTGSTVKNVFTVAAGLAHVIQTGAPDASKSVYGKFQSGADLYAAVNDKTGLLGSAALASFDGFESAYWTITETGVMWKANEVRHAAALNAQSAQFRGKEYKEGEADGTFDLPNPVLYALTLSGAGKDNVDATLFAQGTVHVQNLQVNESKTVLVTVTSLVSGETSEETFTVKKDKDAVTFTTVADLDKSDLSKTIDLTADEAITTLTGATVKIGGVQAEVQIDGKVITVTDYNDAPVGEEVALTIETDTKLYSGKVNLATCIIGTFDEFMQIRSNYLSNHSDGDDGKYRDGYYIVDADIDLAATAEINALDANYAETTDKGFNITGSNSDTVKNNWHGVLDGRGHMLYNLSVNARGMLGVIGEQSEVKNIGLDITRTKNDWWGGLALIIKGTVKNVYLEVNSLNPGNGNGTFAKELKGSAAIIDSVGVLKAKDDKDTEVSNHGVLVGQTASSCTLKNAYILASGKAPVIDNGIPDASKSVYGKFASGTALYAAVNDKTGLTGSAELASFDGFESAYWTITETGILWKANEDRHRAELSAQMPAFNAEYKQGENAAAYTVPNPVLYTLSLSGDGAQYVDAEQFVAGKILVDGFTAVGSASVTVTLTSLVSGKTATAAFTVAKKELENVAFTTVVDLDKSDLNKTIDLSADAAITEALTGATVKIGGVQVQAEISGKVITVTDYNNAPVGEEVALTIETDTKLYSGKVNLATVIISNFDEFMQIRTNYWASRSGDNDEKYRDGYYIVDANIDLSATADVFEKSNTYNADTDKTSTTAKGFNITGNDDYNSTMNRWHGVLDGRGHMLYNLHVGARGIFGAIDDTSVIKNVGFAIIRMKNDWWGALAINLGGTVDNVYLEVDSLASKAGNGTFAKEIKDTGVIRNSISVLKTRDDNDTNVNNHGVLVGQAGSACTLNNVYTIATGSAPVIDSGTPDAAKSVYGKFESVEALVTAVKGQTGLDGTASLASFDGFNTEYWTITDTSIVWTSSVAAA